MQQKQVISVDVKARKSKRDGLSFHIVRFSGDALHSGIEDHIIQGVTVKIYSVAKTLRLF